MNNICRLSGAEKEQRCKMIGDQLASLVSWSPWSNRILNERTGGRSEGSESKVNTMALPCQDAQDIKAGSKKVVRWDELVHVRRFQPFQEEFSKRHGSPRVRRPTRHHQTPDKKEVESSDAFQTGGDCRYLTSPMYDL